jgi:hypothetical protein
MVGHCLRDYIREGFKFKLSSLLKGEKMFKTYRIIPLVFIVFLVFGFSSKAYPEQRDVDKLWPWGNHALDLGLQYQPMKGSEGSEVMMSRRDCMVAVAEAYNEKREDNVLFKSGVLRKKWRGKRDMLCCAGGEWKSHLVIKREQQGGCECDDWTKESEKETSIERCVR